MPFDITMPTEFDDGQMVSAGHLDPIVKNILYLKNERSLISIKSADETVNNSATLQDDDHLSLAVQAATYLMEFEGTYNSGGTPGFKTQFSAPVGTTGFVAGIGANAFSGLGITSALNWGGAGAERWIRLFGRMTVTTAGTFKLQWAQTTANASNTILRTGTFIRLTVI